MKYKSLLLTFLFFVPFFLNAQTKIIAHRGFSGIAPENTLISFKKAIDIGADYIELDVHRTKNDSIIVIHDNDIKRTNSDGKEGKVADLNYNEIKTLRMGNPKNFGDKFSDAGIPTLREVLKLAKGKVKVCIEIKVYGIEKQVLKIINDLQMKNDVIIFSFHYRVLAMMRKLDKNINLLLLTDRVDQSTFDYSKIIDCNIIGAGYGTKITKDLIDLAHQKNMKLWKWTVNEEKDMKRLIGLGIDGIITNYPDKALRIEKRIP